MNGRDLRERLLALRPGLKFLFISGFTDGLEADLAGQPAVGFLRKPFEAGVLAAKVRGMLGHAGA
jgi:FixJ family two-component response regulator